MINVLQIIDSLNAGGAERVAVNYANGLVSLINESHICVTREEGLLLQAVEPNVKYIFLDKKDTLDFSAVLRLRKYIVSHNINIVHAHSTSFFIAVLVKMTLPKLKIVWHDHYGNSKFLNKRPKSVLRFASFFFSQILSVNEDLKEWSKKNLLCKKIKCVKNFPVLKELKLGKTTLKGVDGKRVLCLANLRDQKNHIRLIEAFKLVVEKHPNWSMHCVGKDFKDDYSELFFLTIKNLGMDEHIFFYESKSDILNIMKQCEIGVLVSKSEGLPLALLEYGISKMPVIATDVGDCNQLIKNSSYGILITDDDKITISQSISEFINNETYRLDCADKLNRLVVSEYSENKILSDISIIYKMLVS